VVENTAAQQNDYSYHEDYICKVRQLGNYFRCVTSEGFSVLVHNRHGVTPQVSDVLRFYCKALGTPIYGVQINGTVLFYEAP
jgi:hypothetical protein